MFEKTGKAPKTAALPDNMPKDFCGTYVSDYTRFDFFSDGTYEAIYAMSDDAGVYTLNGHILTLESYTKYSGKEYSVYCEDGIYYFTNNGEYGLEGQFYDCYEKVAEYSSKETNNEEPNNVPTDENSNYAIDLIGKTMDDIAAIYGANYQQFVPEGDPSYYYYENNCPYHFICDDTSKIYSINCGENGAMLMEGIQIGMSVENAQNALKNYNDFYSDVITNSYGTSGNMGATIDGRFAVLYVDAEKVTAFEVFAPYNQ